MKGGERGEVRMKEGVGVVVPHTILLCICAAATASRSASAAKAVAVPVIGDAERDSGFSELKTPRTFGLPVAVGNKLYLNFSRGDGHQRLMEVMDLPKRLSEKPRKQDVYSKRDWERHPSHAPPYGYGENYHLTPNTPPAAVDSIGSTLHSKRAHETAFVGLAPTFSSLPCRKASEASLCTGPAYCRGHSLCPGPAYQRVPARRVWPGIGYLGHRGMGASVVMRAGVGNGGALSGGSGGKGFGAGKPDAKDGPASKKSGFSQAKENDPKKFPQMQAVFTCNKCETRQSKVFSRLAYEQGVVVVKCEGCGVQHIMADNLGYFENMTGEKAVNVEDLLRAKGETVDNRLSAEGVTDLKLANPVERPDGTIEVQPERS